jgi:hypothetical protein
MTIAQQLKATKFPFKLYNEKGKLIYYEDSTGFWEKYQYDERGNQTYYENSIGYWVKSEYDEQGNHTYYEDLDGTIIDNRPKQKVVVTMDEVAKKFGITTEQLQIKK